jgi:hypothetical protein
VGQFALFFQPHRICFSFCSARKQGHALRWKQNRGFKCWKACGELFSHCSRHQKPKDPMSSRPSALHPSGSHLAFPSPISSVSLGCSHHLLASDLLASIPHQLCCQGSLSCETF